MSALSKILNLIVTVASLPSLSATLYVTSYVPTLFISSASVIWLDVILISAASSKSRALIYLVKSGLAAPLPNVVGKSSSTVSLGAVFSFVNR